MPAHNPYRLTLLIALLLCAWIPSAAAQESIQFASIGGIVTDPSGAVLPGATVTATQTNTNVSRSGASGRDGRFRLPSLPLGPYTVTVHDPGFADASRTVDLTAGSAFDLAIQLQVTANATAIDVRAPLLEGARTQISGTVAETEIRTLPLNGRSFMDVALLIPGVSPTNTGSNQLFAETSAIPGQGLSVASQRNFSNNFVVDGLSANDDAAGVAGGFYGLETVQEFQVVTSGGQAEFGRALGGYMNVVTRSGTNTIHGDIYEYFRNSRFNAANALSHNVLPLTQSQHGASLGGPLVRNRTFYFANVEQRLLNQSGLVTIAPANATAINTRLAELAYPGQSVSTGIYANPVHYINVLGKIDHQFSSRDQFTARYNAYHVNSRNSRGGGALSSPSASSGLNDTDHTVAVHNVFTFSPRLLNETRGQVTQSTLQALPTDPLGPAVSISGVASFGRLSYSPTGRRNTLVELADNLSYQAGSHALRAGVDFLFNADTVTFPRAVAGSYSFSSLANFLSGTYNNSGFSQTFGATAVSQHNPNVGFYVQDEWKATRRLTLNFGLRYDLQFLRTISTDTNNVSPRAGFAWTPSSNGKTVIRGSFGLFYDRVPLRALANALLSANNTTDPTQVQQINVSLSPSQTGAPVFPNALDALVLPSSVLFSFSTMDRHMQNAYSQQGSLEIERQLTANSTLSVSYQHIRGLHLIVNLNQNAPTCVASGGNNGCRPNPAYGNISQYSPGADSYYDGLLVSYNQRPVRWGNFRISYTYSKALDNVGQFFFSSPIDPHNVWLDYGRSDNDQRHRLTFDGSVHTPLDRPRSAWQWLAYGFQFSTLLQYYSSLPLNITTGTTTVQGSSARPTVGGAYINRNAGTGFDFFNVNLRANRSFQMTERVRLEFIAEAFNALNHTNGLTRNGVFGTGAYPANPSANFGAMTSVNDPRSMQFALRVGF